MSDRIYRRASIANTVFWIAVALIALVAFRH